jgi:hypothetical protein
MTKPFTYEHYRRMITTALERGYVFGAFDARQHLLATARYACILRHDCDYDLVAAGELARIEIALGIRSTWFLMLHSEMYNLLAAPNRDIVETIIAQGHRIALHFSTPFYRTSDTDTLCDRIDEERDLLRRLFGQEVTVVSFHRPSQMILDNKIKIRCCNTYDHDDMTGYHYISDSNMTWREACPTLLFRERRCRHLQLLIHPEWWTEDEQPIERKYETIFRHGFEQAQSVLLRNARTYNTPRHLSLTMPERGGDSLQHLDKSGDTRFSDRLPGAS